MSVLETERSKSLAYYYDHIEHCKARNVEYHQERRKETCEKAKIFRRKAKIDVLTHYSKDGVLACVRCGILDIDVLCLDHIHGGGTQERLRLFKKKSGWTFYHRLRQEGFPEGYQTLCANCNLKKKIINHEDGRVYRV